MDNNTEQIQNKAEQQLTKKQKKKIRQEEQNKLKKEYNIPQKPVLNKNLTEDQTCDLLKNVVFDVFVKRKEDFKKFNTQNKEALEVCEIALKIYEDFLKKVTEFWKDEDINNHYFLPYSKNVLTVLNKIENCTNTDNIDIEGLEPYFFYNFYKTFFFIVSMEDFFWNYFIINQSSDNNYPNLFYIQACSNIIGNQIMILNPTAKSISLAQEQDIHQECLIIYDNFCKNFIEFAKECFLDNLFIKHKMKKNLHLL